MSNLVSGFKWSYKNKVRHIIYGCIAIPTVILCFIIVLFVYNSYKNDIKLVNVEFSEIQRNEMKNYIDTTSDKIAYLMNYEELKSVLMEKETDFEKSFNDTLRLTNSLNANFGYEDSTLIIYTNNKNVYESKFVKKAEEEEEEEEEIISLLGGELEERKIYTLFSERNGDVYFDMITKFSFFDENSNIIKISINAQQLLESFNYPREKFCIAYDTKTNKALPLRANKKEKSEEIFREYRKGKKTNYSVIKTEEILENYVLYSFVNVKDLKDRATHTMIIYVCLFFVFAVLIVFLVNKIVYYLTARITASADSILTSDEAIGILENKKSYNEFDVIEQKLESLKKNLLDENKKIVELELKQLGARISFHFLYNIFAAIKIRSSDIETIRSIEYLSEYCRNAFHKSAPLITVEQEMENIKLYVNLLQYSYGKDFVFEIENEILREDCLILSDIVQPLIENAFIHGINCCEDIYGEIVLKLCEENDNIIIEVYDNALKADCEEINLTLESSETLDSAVKVINKRIKLYYGEKYGLGYFEKNGYTVARIVISNNGK